MTEGEVCPDGAKIVLNQMATASLRSVLRFIQRNTRLWFPCGTCSATIGTEFGSHLGNVGLEQTGRSKTMRNLIVAALVCGTTMTAIGSVGHAADRWTCNVFPGP